MRAKTLAEKFWYCAKKQRGCWIWSGETNARSGYGQFRMRRKHIYAHRASWELANGPIPAGVFVLHHCDIRACVNPEHLFLGSHRDNMRDAASKGKFIGRNHVRGELHPMAKLTWPGVRFIRSSDAPSIILSKQLGVSRDTVNLIRANKIWTKT